MSQPDPSSAITHFCDAWNRHDAEELSSVFSDDATFVNVTGLWWTNRDRIRQAHAYGFTNIFGSSTMRVGRTDTRYLGDSYAVTVSRLHVTGQVDPSGNRVDDRQTVMTLVVALRDGRWTVVSAQNTDVPPGGMETHVNQSGPQTPTRYR